MRKQSIFVSIMASSLLALGVIFLAVFFLIRDKMFTQNVHEVETIAVEAAESITSQAREVYAGFMEQLTFPAQQLSELDVTQPENLPVAEQLIKTLITVSRNFACVWVVFEAGTFADAEAVYKSFAKVNNEIIPRYALTPELLADPEKSPWYNVPKATHQPYLMAIDHYDYGGAVGKKYIGAASLPLIANGRLLGVFGADLWFSHFFDFVDTLYDPARGLLITNNEGEIIYARNSQRIGMNLFAPATPALQHLQTQYEKNEPVFTIGDSPFNGERMLMGLVPLKLHYSTWHETMYLYHEYPLAELQQKTATAVRTITLLMISGLFLFAVILFFAARRIANPIKNIIHMADEIARGNLAVKFSAIAGKTSEVAQLQQSLAIMLSELNQGNQLKLDAVKSSLEKEQALENIRARTEFFARMSHEIRTPMNAIIGFSQVLQAKKLAAEDQELVTNIMDSSQILLQLISDILDLAKLDAQKFTLSAVQYNLSQLLNHLSAMGKTLTATKTIVFREVRDEKLPPYLFGDDIRLKQVLLNLLSNAIKFTEKGEVVLSARVENKTLVFAISDTGMGIKQEDIASLFDIFRQVNMQKTRAIIGTGLGLAISQQLVKLMGGEIRIASVYGKGTTFTVIIPCVLGDEKMVAATENASPTTKNSAPTISSTIDAVAPITKRAKADAQILVVDDNQMNLLVAAQLLKMTGVNAETVNSGANAVYAVQQKDYDLIFMDHMMPEMDGIETLQAIRNLGEQYKKIPIISLTANAVEGAREEFLAHGFNDFISKPLDLNVLRKLIDGYFA